jgi:23S rRNA G2069 N7-methylase RlmK/C1962 C5-methylase RlmI
VKILVNGDHLTQIGITINKVMSEIDSLKYYISENLAKVSHQQKVIMLSYGLFQSGTRVSTYEKYGGRFIKWLVNNSMYDDYRIVINQSSEPICNAGIQSLGNHYFENYKDASKIFKTKNREVWFMCDSDGEAFSKWIFEQFGFKTLSYHFHFHRHVVHDAFYNGIPSIKTKPYEKKFIIINGNIQNEHKPKAMNLFTQLNLWDDSYWSFNHFTNFGMEIYKDRTDLYRIFKNLIPLFQKSFLYIVTETVSDNFYMNTNIPMDFMSKMGRALYYPTPFVVVGNVGVLKRLHDMGFKTFSDFWDEGYDDESNLDNRINKIKEILNWIKGLNVDELLAIRNDMLPIFEHNRKVMLELQEKENLEISKLFPKLLSNNTLYQKLEFVKMEKFKIESNNQTTDVLYYKSLDGGGTTFGINALKGDKVQTYIKKGNVLEMCSGPGFMGFYLKTNGFADNLYLTDINESNKECIDATLFFNNLSNVEFIKSDCFENIPKGIIFDTIVSNPPHFKTKRPGGYRSEDEMRISLDADMKIHKSIFKDAKNYMSKDSRLILVENCDGVTEDDIRKMIDGKYGVEYVEYNSYEWSGKSTFYTIVLYLL